MALNPGAETPETSIAEVARHFEIPGAFAGASPHGSGHINGTYRVSFLAPGTRQDFILQRINRHVFKDPGALMQNIQRVTAHLSAKVAAEPDRQRLALTLIPTRDAESHYIDEAGNWWRAFRFVENARSYDQVESPHQAWQAGLAYGRFQQLLADLPAPPLHTTIPDFHHTPKRLAALERAIALDAAARVGLVGKELEFLFERRGLAVRLLEADLPQRITHNDTKFNNVMLDEATGDALCVIDLDTVMPGLALYDFGDMVRTATTSAPEDGRDLSKVGMRFPYFEALLRGYLAATANFLTHDEKRHLVAAAKVIVFEQAMRFLTDYLSGDTYYKVHSPEQNLDRCRTQLRLLASIEEQEAEMDRLLASLIA